MDITAQTVEDKTIVILSGELDGKSAPAAQEQIMPSCKPGCKLLLDMSQVSYMSSAGLRLMLSLHRHITTVQGSLVLVGLSDDLQDTMSATGFLAYFTTSATLEDGQALLDQGT